MAEANCLLSAAAQVAGVNDNVSIRILHVLQGPLGKSAGFQLLKWVLIRNPAKFIEPSRRTPPTALDSVHECNIERRAINACLSARDDFHQAGKAFSRRSEQCPRARPSG